MQCCNVPEHARISAAEAARTAGKSATDDVNAAATAAGSITS